MSTPEGKIQLAILKKLKKSGIFCWRNNNAPTYDQKLNSGYGGYRSNNVMPGVPDILGILPGGKFFAVEVKTKAGRQSAPQILFQKRTERLGGIYIVARSKDDVDNLIKSISV